MHEHTNNDINAFGLGTILTETYLLSHVTSVGERMGFVRFGVPFLGTPFDTDAPIFRHTPETTIETRKLNRIDGTSLDKSPQSLRAHCKE